MVDYFALAVSHGVLALAVWRLALRVDLDRDPSLDDETKSDGEAAPRA